MTRYSGCKSGLAGLIDALTASTNASSYTGEFRVMAWDPDSEEYENVTGFTIDDDGIIKLYTDVDGE